MQVQTTNKTSKVTIIDNKIHYIVDNDIAFDIDTNQISIIGEFTNDHGPALDDWFLVLVSNDGNWNTISWYADNIDNLTKHLSDHFQNDIIKSSLVNSSTWKSSVIYPSRLNGKPLFNIIPTEYYKEPKTLFDKILHGCGLGGFDTTKYIQLTDEVISELHLASR